MAARRRFIAPARDALDPACFDAPLFAGFAMHADWFGADQWPSIEALNAALGDAIHPHSGAGLQFVEQTPALLADGLHYEQRIHERGLIATRSYSWHDLFNALIWIRHLPLKAALNTRQYHDLDHVGGRDRTRAQCALTHFDEAGALVVLRDSALLDLWDAHDWHGLFWRERDAWRDARVEVIVFGHALLEHGLQPNPLHSAKCLAVLVDVADEPVSVADVIDCAAETILAAHALTDPQQLRPLPLSGIPHWHPSTIDENFFTTADCFRPLRPGRRYPAPLQLSACNGNHRNA